MIARSYDPAYLNHLANSPDVRPYVGPGTEPLDLTALVANKANIAIEAEHGGWLLINLMSGTYELHTMFTVEGRGEAYFSAAREALRYVFTQTDCLEIVTRCPDDNPGARMAAVKVGFQERAHREKVWRVGEEDECGISYQALTLDDWLKRDDAIEDTGAEVLGHIEAAQKDLPDHLDEDPVLNRLVGALVMMMRGGQTGKGVAVFNRAATFYGYPSIVALRHDLADIAGTIVHVKPDGVGVLVAS